MNIFEILHEIDQTYPQDIFPDTTQDERDDVIERYPGFIDRTSAMMGRHLAKVIREKLIPEGSGTPLGAIENLLKNIYEFGAPTDSILVEQVETAVSQLQKENWQEDRVGELVNAVEHLLQFKLELIAYDQRDILLLHSVQAARAALKKIQQGRPSGPSNPEN